MDNIHTLKDKINNKIGENSYYYISNSMEHAQGLEKWVANFKGICLWDSEYSLYLKRRNIDLFCFNNEVEEQSEVKSAAQILDFIIDNKRKQFESNSYFQTFKISPRLTTLVKSLEGILMNSSDDLNRLFESKVSQAEIFDKYGINFPKTIIAKLKDFNYVGLKNLFGDTFVIQFNRGHTGNGTVFIKDEQQYLELQQKFPNRILRIAEYIESPTYTVNGCATRKGIYLSGLCRQISGVPELSADHGGTVGNNYVHGLSNASIWGLFDEVKKLSKAFEDNGYSGLFGIDFLIKDDKPVLLEINARQTMSVPFNSNMQEALHQIPIMLIHIAEFLNIDYEIDIESYNLDNTIQLAASQLILRNKNPQTVTINNEIKSGEYAAEGGNLVYKKPVLYIDQIESNSILIINKLKGTKVPSGEEIARIQIKQNAYIDDARINPNFINLLLDLEKKLIY